MFLDPALLASAQFGCLDDSPRAVRGTPAYWENFNRCFFGANGLAYETARDSNVEAFLEAPDRAPFARMAKALLDPLARAGNLPRNIDLVVLCHWLPDIHLGTSVTNFVLHEFGLENAIGFAISDRGPDCALFGMDLVARMLAAGKVRRAMLLAMDQRHLLYRSADRDRVDPVNAASVCLLDSSTGRLNYDGFLRVDGGALTDPVGAIARVLEHFDPLDVRPAPIVLAEPALIEATARLRIGRTVAADTRLASAAALDALCRAEPFGDGERFVLLVRHADTLTACAFKSADGLSGEGAAACASMH